jgi:hypothetical protein
MRQQGGSHESKDRRNCRHDEHRARCIVGHRTCAKLARKRRHDASLREALERKDVPGLVALVTDRQRVL